MSDFGLVRVPGSVVVLQLSTGLNLTWGCCEIGGLTQDEAQTVIDLLVDDPEQKAGKVDPLQNDLRSLADAVMKAESILRNDLLRSRASNALVELDAVRDIAMNYMSEE